LKLHLLSATRQAKALSATNGRGPPDFCGMGTCD